MARKYIDMEGNEIGQAAFGDLFREKFAGFRTEVVVVSQAALPEFDEECIEIIETDPMSVLSVSFSHGFENADHWKDEIEWWEDFGGRAHAAEVFLANNREWFSIEAYNEIVEDVGEDFEALVGRLEQLVEAIAQAKADAKAAVLSAIESAEEFRALVVKAAEAVAPGLSNAKRIAKLSDDLGAPERTVNKWFYGQSKPDAGFPHGGKLGETSRILAKIAFKVREG